MPRKCKKLIYQVLFNLFILNGEVGADIKKHEKVIQRRIYGLNFASKCDRLDESFKCMSVCKSIGYKVFRMDFQCRCFCHNIPSTTFLPFFKYVTNSTISKRPTTRSPRLFEIAADTQPPPTSPPTTPEPTTPPPQKETTKAGDKADDAAGGGSTAAGGDAGASDGGDAPADGGDAGGDPPAD